MLIKLNVIVNSDKIRINKNDVYCKKKKNFLWNLKIKLKRSLKTIINIKLNLKLNY